MSISASIFATFCNDLLHFLLTQFLFVCHLKLSTLAYLWYVSASTVSCLEIQRSSSFSSSDLKNPWITSQYLTPRRDFLSFMRMYKKVLLGPNAARWPLQLYRVSQNLWNFGESYIGEQESSPILFPLFGWAVNKWCTLFFLRETLVVSSPFGLTEKHHPTDAKLLWLPFDSVCCNTCISTA